MTTPRTLVDLAVLAGAWVFFHALAAIFRFTDKYGITNPE